MTLSSVSTDGDFATAQQTLAFCPVRKSLHYSSPIMQVLTWGMSKGSVKELSWDTLQDYAIRRIAYETL